MNFAVDGAYDRFADIARYLGLTTSVNDKEAAEVFLSALKDLLAKLHVCTMSEFGIDRDTYFANIDKMASDAFASGSPSNTIKEVSVEDMKKLYREIYR